MQNLEIPIQLQHNAHRQTHMSSCSSWATFMVITSPGINLVVLVLWFMPGVYVILLVQLQAICYIFQLLNIIVNVLYRNSELCYKQKYPQLNIFIFKNFNFNLKKLKHFAWLNFAKYQQLFFFPQISVTFLGFLFSQCSARANYNKGHAIMKKEQETVSVATQLIPGAHVEQHLGCGGRANNTIHVDGFGHLQQDHGPFWAILFDYFQTKYNHHKIQNIEQYSPLISHCQPPDGFGHLQQDHGPYFHSLGFSPPLHLPPLHSISSACSSQYPLQ